MLSYVRYRITTNKILKSMLNDRVGGNVSCDRVDTPTGVG